MRHALAVAALVLVAAGAWLAPADEPPSPLGRAPAIASEPDLPLESGTAPLPLAVELADPADEVHDAFRRPPGAGLLFDLDTGEVLWRRDPTRPLPIASLTKMMTALVAVERIPQGGRVPVTRQALNYRGSGVGMFRRGRRIGIGTMLHGLMLPSGNDAAIAIAQHAAGGSVRRFVQLMNAKASQLGLTCSRFSNPDGYVNRGNYSCAADLAAIGRAVMRQPRLRRIVGRRSAVLPFPTRGGRLYLYNHNPLLRARYRGTTGIKTGYTEAAGRCIVATVERGGTRLGVVLLDSPDPGRQARHLLDRGFAIR